MRCLTIAGALRTLGAEVFFVSADDQIAPYVQKGDYAHRILDTFWDDMEAETDTLIDFLRSEDISVLLVDSYSVTYDYFRVLKEAGIRVMYMDDVCKAVYPVHALVNYCPSAASLGYNSMYGDETGLYLGSSYIPLREQFGQGIISSGDGLLVTAGGADSLGLTDIIVRNVLTERGLGYSEADHARIHLLAGRFYNASEEMKGYISDGLVILHQSVDNVAQIMSGCRAAISSAGTTLFELSAVGVITASYVFADNQMSDALFFARSGLMPYIGDFRVSETRCVERIIDFLYDINGMEPEELDTRSRNIRRIVDGLGAGRIAEVLIGM